MIVPASGTTPRKAVSAVCAEDWERFASAELASLGLTLQHDAGGLAVTSGEVIEQAEAPVGSRSGIWNGVLKTRRRPVADEPAAPVFAGDSPAALLAWLADRIDGDEGLSHFVPAGEPKAVHEVVAAMFDAYQIDGGAIHLQGCHLEPAPVLRLSTVEAASDALRVVHRYFDETGRPLEEQLVERLNLAAVEPHDESVPRASRADWAVAIDAAKTSMPDAATPDCPWMIAAVLLPKRAHGRLEVVIGEESLTIAFDGWARRLSAPAATCPQTGEPTFHLTSTSDGLIASAGQVVVCEETGHRVLRSGSVVCSVSGKRVALECCKTCPVSGKPALPNNFTVCRRCGQRVSQTVLTRRGCRGCDTLTKSSRDDPRVAEVLAAAPKLAEKKLWRIAETEAGGVIIAETGSLLTRTLVVVDRASGAVRYAATRIRPAPNWRQLTSDEQRRRLG